MTSKIGDKVKVHYYLIGFQKFIEPLENNTTWMANQVRLPTKENNIGRHSVASIGAEEYLFNYFIFIVQQEEGEAVVFGCAY